MNVLRRSVETAPHSRPSPRSVQWSAKPDFPTVPFRAYECLIPSHPQQQFTGVAVPMGHDNFIEARRLAPKKTAFHKLSSNPNP